MPEKILEKEKTYTCNIFSATRPALYKYFVFSLQIICWLDLPRYSTSTLFSWPLHKNIVIKILHHFNVVARNTLSIQDKDKQPGSQGDHASTVVAQWVEHTTSVSEVVHLNPA